MAVSWLTCLSDRLLSHRLFRNQAKTGEAERREPIGEDEKKVDRSIEDVEARPQTGCCLLHLSGVKYS